jgi:hypothetical protein
VGAHGPGNTHTVDGADKYVYVVSTDGYAYNGNFVQLARAPLGKILRRGAWQFYHGRVGGAGRYWTASPVHATRILQVRNGLSQPAIQYVPALKRYLLLTFRWSRAGPDFPTPAETPYSRFRFYTAPKPWGPWTKVYEHATQRNLWCSASPCHLIQEPGSTALTVGTPDDWLGLFDPALVQKHLFTRPLDRQVLFTDGDWNHRYRYPTENLHVLHAMPLNLHLGAALRILEADQLVSARVEATWPRSFVILLGLSRAGLTRRLPTVPRVMSRTTPS